MGRASVKMSVTESGPGLGQVLKLLRDQGAHVKVGVLEGTPGGDEKRDGGLSNAELAAVHEFGSADGHIPERSFVRSTFDANRAQYVQDLGRLLAKVVEGKMTIAQAFNVVGAKFAADIKKRVTAGEPIPPPNAPSTIARKVAKGKWNKRKKDGGLNDFAGTIRTLVDTGRMVASITWAFFAQGDSK